MPVYAELRIGLDRAAARFNALRDELRMSDAAAFID
jgi:hypothetical protein